MYRSDRSHESASSAPPRSRLQFEMIFASLWLAVGLFLAPALIYWVGIVILGPYGESAGLGTFYADFFGDLASFTAPAWIIALGPLVLVSLVRLMLLNWGDRASDADDSPEEEIPPRQAEEARRAREDRAQRPRIEPRIGQDPH